MSGLEQNAEKKKELTGGWIKLHNEVLYPILLGWNKDL
jgi:hypothetical protein